MSLMVLANRHVRRYYARSEPGLTFSDSPAAGQADPSNWVDRVMAYIPTEVISAYIPLAALAQAQNHLGRASWILFFVFAASSPLAVWLLDLTKYRYLIKQGTVVTKYAFPLFESIAAFVAFIAWAMAMPATVFTSEGWFQAWMGTATVITITFILNLVGPLFERVG